MAKSRTCERCGARVSPHIPRVRANDGRLVCQGCSQALSRERVTSTAAKGKKKPQEAQESFDFWDGDLAPEGHHPLAAPLPASVWEKFHQKQQLRGKPLLSPEHFAEAENPQGDPEPLEPKQESPRQTRLRLWRRKRGSLGRTAAEVPHGAENMQPGPDLVQHLKDTHGVAPIPASLHGYSPTHHTKLHEQGADHTHDAEGNVVPSAPAAKPVMPHPKGVSALNDHLTQHHPIANWELEGMEPDDVADKHNEFHHNTAYSGADAPNHSHSKNAPAATAPSGSEIHPPAAKMHGKQIVEHLKDVHKLDPYQLLEALKSGGEPTDGGTHAGQTWHDAQHAAGAPHAHGHTHEVMGANGPEEIKHPSQYTVSSMKTHLLTDHGIDPDHLKNAAEGTLESTHASHVSNMLHDQVHADGKAVHPHTHEDWSGPEAVHSGHKDLAKPFWGAPPNDVAKSYDHLISSKSQGGHGMDPTQVHQHLLTQGVDPLADDGSALEAQEELHGGLHQAHGASMEHQHVPTASPVKNPQQIAKEKLQKHLMEAHGLSGKSFNPQMEHTTLHDPEAFDYKGHPGHEHPAWDKDGPMTQVLPSQSGGEGGHHSTLPKYTSHHLHPAAMSKSELASHLSFHDTTNDDFLDNMLPSDKPHEQLLQEHALHHAQGVTNGHTHESNGGMTNPLEDVNAHYGTEPEIQTHTHPATVTNSDALSHLIKHHPNVSLEHYKVWQKQTDLGKKATPKDFHEALHGGPTYGVSESSLPKALDGHDHAPEMGPKTTIAVGHHLVHEHGMDQSDVAAMTPAEFKAHHENLHLQKPEDEVGHGHDYPGGPQRDPRTYYPNTHHEMMRDDSKHPATQEWYHGTATDYEGAPKNATELQEGHGFWGNYGGGDWNNHVGSHWSSLHEMAKNFQSDRVIHAKLHMSNPIVYNSLNHMSHDAYERLRASGHMQDGGEYENNHDDDNGYNQCCSDNLLAYAKGHHRDDGKFGLEAYRDSLRASGHDGIVVRNQADSPHGHWNAIPLSADQIEVTNGGCRGHHGDARDNDINEFNRNSGKTMKGWVHPKHYSSEDYTGKLGHLPDNEEVSRANGLKKNRPMPFKTAEGRGDSDPYLNGRQFHEGDDDEDEHYCEHCNEMTNHSSNDCEVSKWCDVCGEHGGHTTSEEHSFCTHCDDYADHDSDGHEDEYGEHPDEIRPEGYCPSCDKSTKDNYNKTECANCGEKLPDWGKLAAHGTPVKPEEYKADGDTGGADYGFAHDAPKHPQPQDAGNIAAHLYHHHKSDVSGKEFEKANGEWDEGKLHYHHKWLHLNPKEAESQGFAPVDHTHRQYFGQFKPADKMSPEEVHAHMLLTHCGSDQGGSSSFDLKDVAKMTPQEAVEAHKKAHWADEDLTWGAKDEEGDLHPKISHSHNLSADESFDTLHENMPHGEHLMDHLGDKTKHLNGVPSAIKGVLEKSPATAEALHQQMHDNYGPSAEPHLPKFHLHDEQSVKDVEGLHQVKQHLKDHHGLDADGPDQWKLKGTDLAGLIQSHKGEHTSAFPSGKSAEHTHFGGVHNEQHIPSHTDESMKKAPSQASLVLQHLKEHHGATDEDVDYIKSDASKLMGLHSTEHGGKLQMFDKPQHEHSGLGTLQHVNDPMVHTNESMKSTEKAADEKAPELKSTTAQDLVTKDHGYNLESHMAFHHPDVSLQHSEGFDYAPGTHKFTNALQEAHEAHLKAHAEGSDHNHNGTAMPKESSLRRTLSDLFEEVAS